MAGGIAQGRRGHVGKSAAGGQPGRAETGDQGREGWAAAQSASGRRRPVHLDSVRRPTINKKAEGSLPSAFYFTYRGACRDRAWSPRSARRMAAQFHFHLLVLREVRVILAQNGKHLRPRKLGRHFVVFGVVFVLLGVCLLFVFF